MIPNIHKILYATDLSHNSIYALGYAISTAISLSAEIVILHVFEDIDPASRTMLNLYVDDKRHNQIFAEHKTEAQGIISKRLEALRDQGHQDQSDFADKVTSIEICEGFPAEAILSKADEFDCDVIVMGTHSKGILENTFLGSTAKRVLRRSRKPVFIIPLSKEETGSNLTDV